VSSVERSGAFDRVEVDVKNIHVPVVRPSDEKQAVCRPLKHCVNKVICACVQRVCVCVCGWVGVGGWVRVWVGLGACAWVVGYGGWEWEWVGVTVWARGWITEKRDRNSVS
jgi:hypothetical protein